MSPFFLLVALFTTQALAQTKPSCDSKVYCQGNLLHTVQLAQIYDDSKTFVDMKMKNDESTTLKNFDQFMTDNNNNPTKDQIAQFVNDNFEPGEEIEDWIPTDFVESPKILARIEDEEVRNFTQILVEIWPKLTRKIKQEVIDNPKFYSILPVTHGFVIPGGRFREFYYWDSYWIVKGLLVSEMYTTVRGMLENFLSIVDAYGFLPNGARVYYLNRSQPPLLTEMVDLYIKATNDTKWLQDKIKILDKELRYWLDNKLVEVQKDGSRYTLAHYEAKSDSPRPESYFEDFTTAEALPDLDSRRELWTNLKSGAESGWDFSSRWIVDETGGNKGNITLLKTRRIIPVDLNSILCQAFFKLGEFYLTFHDYDNAIFWLQKSADWEKNIEQVFYNSDDGIWYDWDNQLGQHRKYFYPSNFAPLWTGAVDPLKVDDFGRKAANYFVGQNIMSYNGGIPTSISATGEQWDYPNAWPPLQSIVIMGLDSTGNCKAKTIAKEFANRWIKAMIIGYNESQEMYEKYDANNPGKYGGGGEYVVQSGFGWTNGVAFELIERFFATPVKKRNK